MGRWKRCNDKLLHEENHRSVFEDGVPNDGLTQGISRNDVKVSSSGVQKGKTSGMYGIQVE